LPVKDMWTVGGLDTNPAALRNRSINRRAAISQLRLPDWRQDLTVALTSE